MTTWQQSGLFDDMYGGLPPHQKHADTSKAAALALDESQRHTQRGAVLRYLMQLSQAGATDEEMQLNIPMKPNTQRPRRRELEQAGLVADSGKQRRVISGLFATVWIAKS